MDDLADLRKKKIEQLQKQAQNHLQQQQQMVQQVEYLESMVKHKLSKEALTRYGTLKSAHPEKAVQLLAVLAQYAQQIDTITDDQLKQMLLRMETPKRETTIRRI